ncbi:MAG: flagellar biosynthesis protein FlhA [Ruminococcus sp.]|jgi:flagellar biosynthesis protein FlhA|nr:flagellar biosynthesis protein FlhA [Ruminococcus sp.]
MVKKIVDNAVTVFIVLAVFMIIIPLPAPLLDFLFVFNIALSVIILLITMYAKEALDFAVFPSLLLITTIFRLALNISSTKLILLNDGYAGEVVKAFGEFVMGGNAVVGFVVFVLIMLVQLTVITAGAGRIAEVTARFTLDAMPGKQMAIDADLNQGIIDDNEAKHRRDKIQREADYFGAMDGASKFVKGDATFSVIAAVVNLAGGIVIGLIFSGMDIMTVISTYSIATVGDGLCSQIPSLLISTAMGMIVTRSASDTSLNIDLIKSFSSQPRTLTIAGVAMLAMCLIPGFPKLQLIILGVGLLGLGFALTRNNKQLAADGAPVGLLDGKTQPEPKEGISELDYYKDIDNVYKLLPVEAIEIEFGYSLIPLADEASGGVLIERVVIFRKQFAQEMGIVFPSVRMRNNDHINPNQYVIKIKGEIVASAEILVDHYLAMDSGGVTEEIDGIDTIEPAFGIPAKWVSEKNRIRAEISGYTLIDPTSVIITHLSEIIRTHAYELLSRQDIKTLLDKLTESNPVLVGDVVPSIVSQAYLQKVICLLLKEGIPVRDLQTILETLADNQHAMRDIDITTEYVRQALKRTITRKFSDGGQLRVITLDSDVENKIVASIKKTEQGSYLALDPQVIQDMMASLTIQIERVKALVPLTIVLTSPIVRIYFKKLVDQFIPNVTVLSFSEIDTTVQIQAVGNIEVRGEKSEVRS